MPRPAALSVEPLERRDVPAAPIETYPVLPFSDPAVLDHARTIAVTGQSLGRRTDAFMKVGDSNSALFFEAAASYLLPLGSPAYNPVASGLAARPELLDTLRAFQSPTGAPGENSFSRFSPTSYPGGTLRGVLPGLAAEVAATNAGIALVMLGTNDLAVHGNPDLYRAQLSELVRILVSAGVVPVLSTVPNHVDNPVLPARVRQFNQVIAEVAEEHLVPVWNLAAALAGIPAEGLRPDGVHLNSSPLGSGDFSPVSLLFAQNVRNLGSLQILDWFRERVAGAPEVIDVRPWVGVGAGRPVYAVGRGEGQGPVVSVADGSGNEVNRFYAFDPAFTGGVRVSVADVNGDAIADVIAAAGPGGGPAVKVFNGADGALLASFFAFDAEFRGGIGSVDAADLDDDGMAEIVVGAGAGGGPVVAVFRGGSFAEVRRFFAFDPSFRGGVSAAAGTFTGVGPAIVAAAGPGGGPVVQLFSFELSNVVASFSAGDSVDRNGVVVAAGDLDGDGSDEVAVGPVKGTPRVRVFDARGTERASFPVGSDGRRAGVRLGVIGESGADRLLVGNGPGESVSVKAFAGLSGEPVQLAPDDRGRAYGVYVG